MSAPPTNPGKVNEAAMAKALSEIITACDPLPIEDVRRVLRSACVFFEIPIGSDPRKRGDNDCG